MAQIVTELGYGKQSIVEDSTFTRLLSGQVYDDEEIRREAFTDDGSGYEYVGVAKAGSGVEDQVWCVIRRSFTSNRCSRVQFRADISWSNRSQGW